MSGATLYAAAAELGEALDRAAPGQQFIYATGPALDPAHPTVALVREAVAAGKARSHTAGRDGEGRLRHMVVKCSAEAAQPARSGGKARPLAERLKVGPEFMESVTGRVLRLLVNRAEAGLPCPSNAEVGRLMGLTPDQAQYQFALLVGQGLITISNPGPRSRVVTITATGQRTAMPAAQFYAAGGK